jgi:hypothetical protein
VAVSLPILRRFEIKDYLLYPGAKRDGEFSHDFTNGVTLIVGTNGLGKTTLINILLRCVIGPFNAPKDTGVVVSARQVESQWQERRTFFSKRVGDQAVKATALLVFDVGSTRFEVRRRLSDMRLIALKVGGNRREVSKGNPSLTKDEGEKTYKSEFMKAVGASSFVAALQMIRQLVFVDENRRPLLWDTASQTAMLRDLLMGASAAGKIRECESRFMSADSRERNLRWQVNRLNSDLAYRRAAQANAGSVSEDVKVLATQLRADLDRKEALEQRIDDSEAEVRRLRLETERSRLAREDARAAVEELRLTMASKLFKALPETGQYILSRFYSGSECRACGAEVAERLAKIDELLALGNCIVCESPPEEQRAAPGKATVAQRSELVGREYASKRQELVAVTEQVIGLEAVLERAEKTLRALSDEIGSLNRSIASGRRDLSALQARLPPDEETTAQRERERESMVVALNTAAQERRTAADQLRLLFVSVREAASAKQQEIVTSFEAYAKDFLSEDATLAYAPREERLGQSAEKFELPRFRLDMTSAAYTGKAPRNDADDVSESQREFIDLAYRMALIDACVEGSTCLIMETPEASLDGVFMDQAGKMLNSYGARTDRQLVVTSNLSSAGMIRALMRDHVDPSENNVVNLFRLAAPTQAVIKHQDAYERLLRECLGPDTEEAEFPEPANE